MPNDIYSKGIINKYVSASRYPSVVKTKTSVCLHLLIIGIFLWDIFYFKVSSNTPFIYLLVVLALYIVSNRRIKFHIQHYRVILFSYLIIHGLISIVAGNDNIQLFLRQIITLAVCFIVFGIVTNKSPIEKIVYLYWNASILMSLFGLIEIVFAALRTNGFPPFFTFSKLLSGVRFIFLASLCSEPSFLGYFLAPITSLIILRELCPERIPKDDPFSFIKGWKAVLVVFISIMTFSLTTYLGLAAVLIIAWFSKGFSFKKLLLPIGIILAIVIVYNTVPDIRMRVNDTLSLFSNNVNSSAVTQNISSWTFYSNFRAAVRGFTSTFGFGNGLGSYQLVYDKYSLGGWNGSSSLLNREDANSMFLRIMAELGIVGIILVFAFFIKFFPKKNNRYFLLSCSILTLYIMLMIRQGNYTHGGVILWIVLYARIPKEGAPVKKIAYTNSSNVTAKFNIPEAPNV